MADSSSLPSATESSPSEDEAILTDVVDRLLQSRLEREPRLQSLSSPDAIHIRQSFKKRLLDSFRIALKGADADIASAIVNAADSSEDDSGDSNPLVPEGEDADVVHVASSLGVCEQTSTTSPLSSSFGGSSGGWTGTTTSDSDVFHGVVGRVGDEFGQPNHDVYRPGVVALQEIRQLDQSTELMIRKLPFQRLVRDIFEECGFLEAGIRIQSNAVLALQESSEAFLVRLFSIANGYTIQNQRVTLLPEDIRAALAQMRSQSTESSGSGIVCDDGEF